MPFISDRSITKPSSHTAKPATLWPGAADGNEQVLLPREIHRRDHIVAAGAAGDECGTPVDRGVEYGACGVVPRIAWKNQFAAKAGFQLVNGGRSNHCGPPFFGFFHEGRFMGSDVDRFIAKTGTQSSFERSLHFLR